MATKSGSSRKKATSNGKTKKASARSLRDLGAGAKAANVRGGVIPRRTIT